MTVFVGIGLSGYLGEYASQLFARNGIASVSVNDFTAQLNGVYNSEDVAIVLSVSGETKEVNKQILTFKKEGLTVVVVSNTENNTAAHLADFVISYYVLIILMKCIIIRLRRSQFYLYWNHWLRKFVC